MLPVNTAAPALPKPQRLGRQRARSLEDKDLRRGHLLSAAADLFAQSDFEGVTIAKMAQRAGVAKGTAYLYFSCKEAVFLELLQVGLDEWASGLHSALQTNAQGVDSQPVPAVIASSLAQRPLLGRLLVLLHTIIEPQLDLESARSFKFFLHDLVERLSASLVTHIDGLYPVQAAVFVLQMHALVISVTQLASPPPVIAQVLQEDARLRGMVVSFEPFLSMTLSALLRGTLATSPPTS